MEPVDRVAIENFQQAVWQFYKVNARNDLPWRLPDSSGSLNPYHVFISEIMLQQTQVTRVVVKFHEFLKAFPTMESLARAQLSEVLRLWSGLGYNRRAKFLHQAAQKIVTEYNGKVPKDTEALKSLPGVGANTAAAIAAYSFNAPVVFIETNIRTVFIHHFFQDHEEVNDVQLLPYIEASLDPDDSRQWYWALMDYGSYLKATHKNPGRKSKHHTVQSKFVGSKRQIRGQVLKLLIQKPFTQAQLVNYISDSRLPSVLVDLSSEGLIAYSDGTYTIGK